MSYMLAERLEVRLDPQRRLKLERLAVARGIPLSQLVRVMIDEAYEQSLGEERLEAAMRIGEMAIEDVPEPDVLKRQLEATYDLCHLR